jgi:hypothetical protein
MLMSKEKGKLPSLPLHKYAVHSFFSSFFVERTDIRCAHLHSKRQKKCTRGTVNIRAAQKVAQRSATLLFSLRIARKIAFWFPAIAA